MAEFVLLIVINKYPGNRHTKNARISLASKGGHL